LTSGQVLYKVQKHFFKYLHQTAETNMQLGTLSAPLDSLMSALLMTYFIHHSNKTFHWDHQNY